MAMTAWSKSITIWYLLGNELWRGDFLAVKIISDSTCDLSVDLLEKYGIAITPMTVTLGERSGCDGIDITPDDIYAYVEKTGELPKTSSVNVSDYVKVFRIWRDQGYEIVHFNISSILSASSQNARIAAEEIGGVYPVDSKNLSTGQGLVALRAAEMAKQGASTEEIIKTCEDMIPRVEASFAADSIDYLRKGGRCSALAAVGANLLHIKPCIEVIDGKMKPGKKYRGKPEHVIRSYVEDRLKDRHDIDMHRIFITHTKIDAQIVAEVRTLIQYYCPKMEDILETTAGATITTHCGPGTLGVFFVRDSQ